MLALGIAVATRCDPCIAFHAEVAEKHGASRKELLETVGIAIYMGIGPSVMYAAKALEAFDLFTPARRLPGGPDRSARSTRTGNSTGQPDCL